MNILKPKNFDPNHYFNHYINAAPDLNLLDSLAQVTKEMVDYMNSLNDKGATYAYEEGKWSIKQVLQHINDTERILAYRALRISRKDTVNLLGFDQDIFANNDFSDDLSLLQVKEEFVAIRQSTDLMYAKMNASVIDFEGMASNFSISPRALGFVISGHAKHHLSILKTRYVL